MYGMTRDRMFYLLLHPFVCLLFSRLLRSFPPVFLNLDKTHTVFLIPDSTPQKISREWKKNYHCDDSSSVSWMI